MTNLPPTLTGYPRPTHPPAPIVVVTAVLVPAPPYTLLLAMNTCVLTRVNEDQTFATDVFIDEFESCKDMSNEDLIESFKTFSGMTAIQG